MIELPAKKKLSRKIGRCWTSYGHDRHYALVSAATLPHVEHALRVMMKANAEYGGDVEAMRQMAPHVLNDIVEEACYRMFVLPFKEAEFRTSYLENNGVKPPRRPREFP